MDSLCSTARKTTSWSLCSTRRSWLCLVRAAVNWPLFFFPGSTRQNKELRYQPTWLILNIEVESEWQAKPITQSIKRHFFWWRFPVVALRSRDSHSGEYIPHWFSCFCLTVSPCGETICSSENLFSSVAPDVHGNAVDPSVSTFTYDFTKARPESNAFSHSVSPMTDETCYQW